MKQSTAGSSAAQVKGGKGDAKEVTSGVAFVKEAKKEEKEVEGAGVQKTGGVENEQTAESIDKGAETGAGKEVKEAGTVGESASEVKEEDQEVDVEEETIVFGETSAGGEKKVESRGHVVLDGGGEAKGTDSASEVGDDEKSVAGAGPVNEAEAQGDMVEEREEVAVVEVIGESEESDAEDMESDVSGGVVAGGEEEITKNGWESGAEDFAGDVWEHVNVSGEVERIGASDDSLSDDKEGEVVWRHVEEEVAMESVDMTEDMVGEVWGRGVSAETREVDDAEGADEGVSVEDTKSAEVGTALHVSLQNTE